MEVCSNDVKSSTCFAADSNVMCHCYISGGYMSGITCQKYITNKISYATYILTEVKWSWCNEVG